ncbi:MAG: glycosyltransferase family 2 protein [Anaerolineae bacterium]|nr:glycosyltransferase family 2 protein [Anaerolineae bacterium]
MSEKRRLVIMPAHNEANNIEAVLDQIRAVDPKLDVLVVDDASTDDTAERARRKGATVVSLPCNLGYGGAVQTGFRYAVEHGYDIGIMMDADGQHDPQSLPGLLRALDEGADVALGSRFLGRMEYNAGWVRRTGMSVFRAIVRRVTRRPFTDPTSGYQALTREVMEFFARDNYPTDFPDADTLIVLHHAGFNVVEVPAIVRARISGTSMHAGWKPIYYVVKMLLSIFVVLLRKQTHTNAIRPSQNGIRQNRIHQGGA